MKRYILLMAGLALAATLVAGIFAATDTRAAFERVTQLLEWSRGAGPLGDIVFIAVQALAATIGIFPASLLSVAAGIIYGLGWGFLLSSAGNMLGAWIAFRLSRSLFRPWIAALVKRHARLTSFDNAIDARDWRFVSLVRVSPIMPFSLTSYALGLTRIGLRPYMTGTLASLPALLVYVAIGAFARVGLESAVGEMAFARSIFLGIGAIAIVATSFYIRRILASALSVETTIAARAI